MCPKGFIPCSPVDESTMHRYLEQPINRKYLYAMPAPLISVITVTYQAEAWIEETVRSITAQDYPHIEHLLIDGGSKDQTIARALPLMRSQRIVVSEKDDGLYDAMNKGLQLATGEFVIFINAGDRLHDRQTLQKMLAAGRHSDCIYGETQMIDASGQALGLRRLRPPNNLNWKSFQKGMCVSHQSVLMRRSIAVSYNTKYRISADIDWCIASLKKSKKSTYFPDIVSQFLVGGVSSNRRFQGLRERWQILVHHYGWWSTVGNHLYIIVRFIAQRLTRKRMQ
jgi:glycosyltransferase involved in cell wall biosynthesis